VHRLRSPLPPRRGALRRHTLVRCGRNACTYTHARAHRHALLHASACAGEVNSISMPSPSGSWTWDCTANCTALPFCVIQAYNKGLTGPVPASIGQLSCRKNVTAVYVLVLAASFVFTLRQPALSISSAAAAGYCLGITSPVFRKSLPSSRQRAHCAHPARYRASFVARRAARSTWGTGEGRGAVHG